MTEGLFKGLRVLELGDFEAAAYCGKLFADLGADVVKVEPPGGAPSRTQGAMLDAGGLRQSGLFAWLNTNKQSVCLAPDEAERLRAMAAQADVLIDGRMDAKVAAWRADLAAAHPDLTIVSLSWFGDDGPYAGYAATDATVRALAGVVWPTGEPHAPPEPLSDHQAGIVGGLNAFTAAVAARMSARTGRRFEISLLEANLSISEFYFAMSWSNDAAERRYGLNRFRPTFPMGVYRCREGWIGVTISTLDQWRGFCDLLDLQAEAEDPALGLALNRFERAGELEARYAPLFLRKTADEWYALALEMRLPFAIAPDMPTLQRTPVHRARGAFAPVTFGEASFEAPVIPQRLMRPKQPSNGPAPLAGTGALNWGTAPAPRPVPPTASRARPLDGVRIVDLTMGWAGPLATRQLADLGAEILKVESCGYTDWWRGSDPREEAVKSGQFEMSLIFNAVNRNKKGVTLDLTHPEGAALLKRLVTGADAVIENYSAGVLPKLGLDYASLCAANPSLVMVSMSAFGTESAWREARAYGSTLEHGSGLPGVTGGADAPPTMNHLALGDPVGGLNAAAALIAALYHRARTGEGQYVDLSQVECLFPLVAPWLIEHELTGEVRKWGEEHPRFSPHGCFPCLGDEEWILIAVTTALAWRQLCGLIGQPSWADDRHLASADGRRARSREIAAAIGAWTAGRDADEAMAELQARGVAAGVVRRPSRLFSDPHLAARGAWEWIDRPWIGAHPQVLASFREDGVAYPVVHPSPLLGEFNEAVLGGVLGLDGAALADLERAGVIGREPKPSTRTSLRQAAGPSR